VTIRDSRRPIRQAVCARIAERALIGRKQVDDSAERPKRKRGTYRKPGCKEVTTRMPVELAAAVRQAADLEGVTVNDYMIALVEQAVRDGVDVRVGAIRMEVRHALQRALARLEGIEPEEAQLATAV